MNDPLQFALDVKHFDVSFIPVIAKNRGETDNFLCMALSARGAGITEMHAAELNQQQIILNQSYRLLESFYSYD